jgi:hypothetical protein
MSSNHGVFIRHFDYVHKQIPMFSTKEEIENRKGRYKMHRFAYLQALVTEFQDSEDEGKITPYCTNLFLF